MAVNDYNVLMGPVGNQQISHNQLPDTTARHVSGTIVNAVSPFWGGGRFVYAKASADVRQFGICRLSVALTTTGTAYTAAEVGNTANLGCPLVFAMYDIDANEFGWFMIEGTIPVNSTSSVAAGTAIGIVAAGQAGVLAAGKQIVSSQVVTAATATIAKTGCTANSGSTVLNVPNAGGWFPGVYLSGTGIAATTTVVEIGSDGTTVTLSAATTAAVNGTVTATYNNATIFYNVLNVQSAFAQGAIT